MLTNIVTNCYNLGHFSKISSMDTGLRIECSCIFLGVGGGDGVFSLQLKNSLREVHIFFFPSFLAAVGGQLFYSVLLSFSKYFRILFVCFFSFWAFLFIPPNLISQNNNDQFLNQQLTHYNSPSKNQIISKKKYS